MTRRDFGKWTAQIMAAGTASGQASAEPPILPGIWRLTFGTPEPLTPVRTRRYPPAQSGLERLPPLQEPPLPLASVRGHASPGGYEITLLLAPREMIYGLGLQFHSMLQRGLKKKLRVNADPLADLGDSHAPVPPCTQTTLLHSR